MYSFIFTYELESKEKRDAFFSELTENDIENKCSNEEGCNIYKYLFAPCDYTHIYISESCIDKQSQQVHCTQPHCLLIQELKKKYGVKSSVTEM